MPKHVTRPQQAHHHAAALLLATLVVTALVASLLIPGVVATPFPCGSKETGGYLYQALGVSAAKAINQDPTMTVSPTGTVLLLKRLRPGTGGARATYTVVNTYAPGYADPNFASTNLKFNCLTVTPDGTM